MNFLSHHAVARKIAPGAPPEFFLGNILPDLVSTSGIGRLRDRHVAQMGEGALAEGVRLHLTADRRFHGLPDFIAACSDAKAILLTTTFDMALTRTFFLAHAMVEIALDGLLIRESVALADDFYRQIQATNLIAVAETATDWMGLTESQPALVRTLRGFVEHRYLYQYTTFEGQAEALHRLSLRAGLPGFPGSDRTRLADAFAALAPVLASRQEALLFPPIDFRRVIQ